jgi:hypothetical protein
MNTGEAYRPDLLGPLLRDLSAEGRSVEIPVRGTSMHPLLQDGDRVQVVPATAADVRMGHVVVLAGSSGPIIHRLVGRWPGPAGPRLLTKGDGAPRLDPPASPDGLIGRVVARVRNGRVRRLDATAASVCGRCRALLSLGAGLVVDVLDRVRRRRGPRPT